MSNVALPSDHQVHDVSMHRADEERLRESEALYRSLIENTSDGIAIIDADGTFSYINPAYERIWGWAAEELIGRQFMQLIHPDDIALSRATLGRLMTEPDGVTGGEIRVRHKDGSWRIVDGTAKRLPNGSIVSSSRDVTARREIEQAVRAVAEGTAAVTGDDFFRSLVKHMAAALRVRYAYVTQSVEAPPRSLRMLACWAGRCAGRTLANRLI